MKIENLTGTAILMDDCTPEEAIAFAEANDMLLVKFPGKPFLGFRKDGHLELWYEASKEVTNGQEQHPRSE
jgi:hypothetical protein